MHNRYDITDATSDYFTINGRSFPYTFRESLVVTKPNEHIKLRVVNGGSSGIALHTHGHKVTTTHLDGVETNPAARVTRDVVWIASAQRVDLDLETTNDGLHSYGSGIWLFHDHQEKGITTDGVSPGGNISAIVYEEYLQENGWPKTQGVDYDPYFTEAYYRKEVPVWGGLVGSVFLTAGTDRWMLLRLLGLALSLGVIIVLLLGLIRKRAH
jgi:hypothetical protein